MKWCPFTAVFGGPFFVDFSVIRSPTEVLLYGRFIKRIIKAAFAGPLRTVKPLTKSDIYATAGDVFSNIRVKDNVPLFDSLFNLCVTVDHTLLPLILLIIVRKTANSTNSK